MVKPKKNPLLAPHNPHNNKHNNLQEEKLVAEEALEEAEEEEEEAEVQVQDDKPYLETLEMETTLITCKHQMANWKDQSMDSHSVTTAEQQATKGRTVH